MTTALDAVAAAIRAVDPVADKQAAAALRATLVAQAGFLATLEGRPGFEHIGWFLMGFANRSGVSWPVAGSTAASEPRMAISDPTDPCRRSTELLAAFLRAEGRHGSSHPPPPFPGIPRLLSTGFSDGPATGRED